jgi:hypothetical protein
MPRLLVCRECATVEELPLYDGPQWLEAHDPLLDNLVQRHVQKHGDINPEAAALLVAPEEICTCAKCRGQYTFWEAHRDEILKGLQERWTGFHPEFYATKDTYTEDALKCYIRHRRPKGTDCIDWQADSKRLTPADWKGREVFLCDFCPCAIAVTTAMRHAKGMYKETG